ncbi:proline-rich receptor-like protein kinase PERK10, partial [Cottoperca gobio]|uniref:Proline-rich receptor-like protein kinase PERK10 n=1 Tax=Cottoperca gobio TaxID=56716 RepID=A0A6J2PA86_COTGO
MPSGLEVMQVEHAVDLLMECDEEEQEVWPRHDEVSPSRSLEAVGPMEDTDLPAVRIIPIPVHPVSSCSPPPTPQHTEGGAAELQLRFHLTGFHLGGSVSGFTSVQVHSPAAAHHISTAACTAADPIITAPRPLPPRGPCPPHSQHPQHHGRNLHRRRPHPPYHSPPGAPPGSSRPAAPLKPLHKGQLGPVSPPDCLVCMSQYKLITELRGFLCLCSPEIAQSLKNLKKKKTFRRSRDKKKTSRKVSKTRPGPSAPKVVSPSQKTPRPPDDFPSDRFTSPAPPSTRCSPHQDQSEPPPDLPHGKLVIMVEDFYYGSDPGRGAVKPEELDRKLTGPYRCIHCPTMLHNNIKLMSHMKEHVSTICLRSTEASWTLTVLTVSVTSRLHSNCSATWRLCTVSTSPQ